jgi:hypothetical protein
MRPRFFLSNGSGNGIDAVYQRVAKGAIAVVEAKFRKLFNANRNAERLMGRGYGFKQMSPPRIQANRVNALNSNIRQAP